MLYKDKTDRTRYNGEMMLFRVRDHSYHLVSGDFLCKFYGYDERIDPLVGQNLQVAIWCETGFDTPWIVQFSAIPVDPLNNTQVYLTALAFDADLFFRGKAIFEVV